MNKSKLVKWGIIGVPLVLIIVFALTYVPHPVVNTDPNKVSKITIFDGNTGNETQINDKIHINYIINNLNEVTFQKEKPSFLRLGYSFRTSIFDDKGRKLKELTIDSSDKIRYNGFFYISKENAIDYNYIDRLVSK